MNPVVTLVKAELPVAIEVVAANYDVDLKAGL